MTNRKTSSIYDTRYQAILSRLIKQRKAAGVSQEAIASALGLSQSDISKIERCERRLDLIELVDYIQALDGKSVYRVLQELLQGITEDDS